MVSSEGLGAIFSTGSTCPSVASALLDATFSFMCLLRSHHLSYFSSGTLLTPTALPCWLYWFRVCCWQGWLLHFLSILLLHCYTPRLSPLILQQKTLSHVINHTWLIIKLSPKFPLIWADFLGYDSNELAVEVDWYCLSVVDACYLKKGG